MKKIYILLGQNELMRTKRASEFFVPVDIFQT